jgi:aminoglycoside phosphotransferase (APT) family kinase protein
MWVVRTETAGDAVLRQMTREPWRTHAAELLAREATVQRALQASVVPVPRPLRIDTTGSEAGVPSLLMTRLGGELCLDDDCADVLTALAATLRQIHALAPRRDARPRAFQSWASVEKRIEPPVWAVEPGLWERAFRILDGLQPDFDGVFMHRDFHLGNVLWQEGNISGVVDWVETSWGPADLDVAHCETNLAMLHGPETARAFRDRYLSGGGVLSDGARSRMYWRVMDVVGFLPTPRKVAGPWRENGRKDVADAVAEKRLEEWLRDVLADDV